MAGRVRVLRARRRLGRVRARAVQYAGNGWPVVPLRETEPREDRPAGIVPVEGIKPSVDRATVADWWAHIPYRVGLATGIVFDVIEAPPELGTAAHDRLLLSVATAMTTDHRWLFIVTPGTALPQTLADAGVARHGAGGSVMAPPGITPGRPPYWLVEPRVPQWRPAQARLVHAVLTYATDERHPPAVRRRKT